MKKWDRLEEEVLHVTPYRRLRRVRCRLPNGHEDDFYLVVRGRIVCALVLTPDHSVVLAQQYRLGPDAVLAELPGGGVEEGERPSDAIAREVLEETGYRGTVRELVTTSDDAWSDVQRTHFVVTDADRVAEPTPEQGEHITVVRMPLGEFRRQVRLGKLTDVETAYLALDALGLLYLAE